MDKTELIVVALLIPSYICLAFILKRFISYGNGYIKGFNAAKKIYEELKEKEKEDGYNKKRSD